MPNENIENVGVATEEVNSTQEVVETKKVKETTTKDANFNADAFFESLSKRADDFFSNNASKQLEKKYGMGEEEIKALISEHKAKQGNDIETLKKELEDARNELKTIKKNEVINNVIKSLDVKADKTNYVLKLADLSNIYNEDGSIDEAKVKTSIESVLNELPEFKNVKEPDYGNFQDTTKKTSKKDEDLFGFNFTKVH